MQYKKQLIKTSKGRKAPYGCIENKVNNIEVVQN